MPRDKKASLAERIADAVRGALEALESLANPQPQLVPIPVRRPVARRRR